MHGETLKKP